MKRIQEITHGDKSRVKDGPAYLNYAKISNGKVYVTDGFLLGIFDVEGVFGEDIISPDETKYIDMKQWIDTKADKARIFIRAGDSLEVYDKKDVCVGRIDLLNIYPRGIFPDVESAIPKGEPVSIFRINPSLMQRLLITNNATFGELLGWSQQKVLKVKISYSDDVLGFMPGMIPGEPAELYSEILSPFYNDEILRLSDELVKAKELIATLQKDIAELLEESLI